MQLKSDQHEHVRQAFPSADPFLFHPGSTGRDVFPQKKLNMIKHRKPAQLPISGSYAGFFSFQTMIRFL